VFLELYIRRAISLTTSDSVSGSLSGIFKSRGVSRWAAGISLKTMSVGRPAADYVNLSHHNVKAQRDLTYIYWPGPNPASC